jgi:hypothetical protein
MTLREGWLNRQYSRASADVDRWPSWMQREAGLVPQGEPARREPQADRPSDRVEPPSEPSE